MEVKKALKTKYYYCRSKLYTEGTANSPCVKVTMVISTYWKSRVSQWSSRSQCSFSFDRSRNNLRTQKLQKDDGNLSFLVN